jgi:transposase-like protein
VNVQALIAVGVNADGHRELLGLRVFSAEEALWNRVEVGDLRCRVVAAAR